MGLQQYVKGATHRLGHTLDLVISRVSDNLFTDQPVIGSFISDHAAILSYLKMAKPQLSQKTINYRKLNNINMDALKREISQCLVVSSEIDLDNIVSKYNATMSCIIDEFAPVVTRRIPIRVRQPWFNSTLKQMKKVKRKLETEMA